METTIKLSKETKGRLSSLDLSDKSKTFDMILNDLITYYEKSQSAHNKDYDIWKSSMKEYHNKRGIWEMQMKDYEKRKKENEKQLKNHNKNKLIWNELLSWAREQGFKETSK